MAQILVVDDEIGIRELLSDVLTDEGHDVRLAENATAARAARDAAKPDLVLLDIWMPDTDGVTLLKEWAANGQLTMPVVMMSGHATIDTAVEATRIGALDFLEKPIGMQKLLSAVARALEAGAKRAHGALSLAAFTRSAPLKDLKKRLEQLAAKSRSLLLKSPAGGIVELAARTLHPQGKTWIDLADSSQPLSLESLQTASGGLLYCEELGRLTRLQQKNLLFAAERLDKYNLHLVVATHHTPSALAGLGWEETHLARLGEVWLGLPSLADLKDEVPDMATHLLTLFAEAGETPQRRLSTAAQNALRQHSWPGGYSELKSAVKSLALGALDEEIGHGEVTQLLTPGREPEEGPPGFDPALLELPLREAREAFERMYFEWHLKKDGGNITRLAERAGMERTHLYRKLKDLGLRGSSTDAT